MKNLNLKIMRPVGFHARVHEIVKKAQKNVKENSGWKINSNCPVCFSKKKKFWLKKINVKIYECLICKTGYSYHVPKNLSEIYDMDSEIDDKIKSHKKRSKYFLKKFGNERIKFIKNFKKRGNLLDFGCGTGEFVNFAQKYFNVNAFDFSNKLSKFVEEKYNIKTYSELNKINKKFDVITLYDVLEHVENPMQLLGKIRYLLKKNGLIFIYSPNKNSLGFDVLGSESNLCTAPFHLTYFNSETIARYMKNKFKIVYLKTFGLDLADIFAYFRDKYQISLNEKNINKFLSYQDIFDNKGYSNHFRIVLKK